jgi:hypothetical protein
MKSIMEEASSISKAIEKAWLRAGEPQSFSIKVLEKPVKNFFGITKKYAKIAFFFNGDYQSSSFEQKERHYVKREERPAQSERKNQPRKQEMSQPQSRPEQKPRSEHLEWTPDMVELATSWINGYLVIRGLDQISNAPQASGHQLTIHLNTPLTQDKRREHLIFSNLAHLTMASLRNKLKKELKGMRILIRTP